VLEVERSLRAAPVHITRSLVKFVGRCSNRTGVIVHNLVRDSRLAEASPGRGGALRMIGSLSGLFVADVQDNRMVAIVVRLARGAIAMVVQICEGRQPPSR
jgi:hypothetical protein